MQNPKNSQSLYHMRKSLLALHRARQGALVTENYAAARDLKKCIDIVSRQIKLLNVTKNDK